MEVVLEPQSIEIYDRVDTTMRLAPPELPGVVIALEQLRGRGRSGKWISPRGGAWLTFVTQHGPPPIWLPVATGGCVAEEVERLLPKSTKRIIRVKWPNDLYIGRGKLGGILVTYRRNLLRIGVGINVYNPIPPGGTRLSSYGFRGGLGEVYAAIIKGIGRALVTPEDCLWEASRRDLLRGCNVHVVTEKGELSGVALGLAPSGALLLKTPNGSIIRIECCGISTWNCPNRSEYASNAKSITPIPLI